MAEHRSGHEIFRIIQESAALLQDRENVAKLRTASQ